MKDAPPAVLIVMTANKDQALFAFSYDYNDPEVANPCAPTDEGIQTLPARGSVALE